MSESVHSVDVDLPVRTVYDQWTQFETFPKFMKGVERIDQITDTKTHWVVEIAGKKVEFDADITEQTPDQRIAWRSRSGRNHGGVVTFHRLGPSKTRVHLQMEYDPQGITEKIADFLGIVDRRMRGDLERFKEFIEAKGHETGAWRGTIEPDRTH
jgi:uncharacterized membrane protein